ncbi:MAG: FHA domain-containing protein [Anaerolineae bacterium]|nr:FHA domain-containing protein [Anaerolineae bacterium]
MNERLGDRATGFTNISRHAASFVNNRLELRFGLRHKAIFTLKEPLYLGRNSPHVAVIEGFFLDLTPYDAYALGVSRHHAVIKRTNDNILELIDLGSSNGTFVNGVRLKQYKNCLLHSGDRLHLGQLLIEVTFQDQDVPAEASASSGAAQD